MEENKITSELKNKVRTIFHEKTEEWYFSIVDIIGILINTTNPSNYWKVQKNRLKIKHKELVTECNQLKMPAKDGKSYLTDVANTETLIRIMELLSPTNLDTLKEYLYQFQEKSIEIKFKEEAEFELTVDAYQDEKNIVIRTMLAGVNSEDLFISVGFSEINISGKRSQKTLDEKVENISYQELSYGTFSRNITLPAEINIDEIETNFFHGMLTLKLPKINKNKKRILKIKY